MTAPSAGALIRVLAIYSFAVVGLAGTLNAFGNPDPDRRAVALMGTALVATWVGGFGWLSWRARDRCRRLLARLPGPWPVRFFGTALALALVEEAITVGLTNLAPWFGSAPGRAYITASASYLEVVAFSSVAPLIAPGVLAWTLLLRRYAFSPEQVLLLFGLSGTIAEASVTPTALVSGFWVFVYGLMVYLPAHAVPPRPGARPPRLRHHLLAVVAPLLLAAPFLALATEARELLGVRFFTDPPLPPAAP